MVRGRLSADMWCCVYRISHRRLRPFRVLFTRRTTHPVRTPPPHSLRRLSSLKGLPELHTDTTTIYIYIYKQALYVLRYSHRHRCAATTRPRAPRHHPHRPARPCISICCNNPNVFRSLPSLRSLRRPVYRWTVLSPLPFATAAAAAYPDPFPVTFKRE